MKRRFTWKILLLISCCLVIGGLVTLARFTLFAPQSVPPSSATHTTGSGSGQAVSALIPTIAAQQPGQVTATATSLVVPARHRLVTFVNKMTETIWVAAASSPAHPLPTSGWLLVPGASASVVIPDAWNGRFWGRTGCTFNASGYGKCATGDCAAKFQCGQSWGTVPATLAEFNLNSYAGLDFYDVSLVDGANLPMYINSFGGTTPDRISANGCFAAGCTKNVLNTCPAVLQIKDASGHEIACDAACNIFHTDQYCCRGAYAARSKCDPTTWPVNYAKIFKAAEPFAYSYPDDDATSTLTCKPECNYRITFGVST